MVLMEFPYIWEEYFPDYNKKFTWNLLHAYIDAHSQILIDEYPGEGVKSISRLKYQCANITFADQSRYNILFQQVIHKVG